MAIACALSIPLGLWLGHIGKGGFLAINVSNVGRAVPSLALIAFFVAYIGVGFTNLTLALVLLAIPPILTNTYTGVRQVDRDTVDSARGMGMTGAQIVRRVELPLALPLIFGGDPHLGGQRGRHRDDRAAGRGSHARRPDHQRQHIRRRGKARGSDRRGPAGGRHGSRPRGGAARGDSAGTEAGGRRPHGAAWHSQCPTTEGKPRHEKASLADAACAAGRRARRGRLRRRRRQQRQRLGATRPRSRRRRSRRTTRTRRRRSRSARRTSRSRRCSGRSTLRRSRPRATRVKKELNLGDEKTALKALESGDITPTRSTPEPRCCRSSASLPTSCQATSARRTSRRKAGFAKKDLTALAADAVHELERGRR